LSFDFNHIKLILTIIYSALSWAFGGLDLMFNALISMMILDYISGILVAVKNKKLSSNVGFKGLCKKFMILIMVIVSNIIDVAIIGYGNTCRTMTIAFYSANEAISILENASNLGLPLPQGIKDVLERFGKE